MRADESRSMAIVIVKETQEVTLRLIHAEVVISVQSNVVRLTHVSDARISVRGDATDLLGLVGRAIVTDEDLELRVVLSADVLKALP